MADNYLKFLTCRCRVSKEEVNARKRSKEIDKWLKESFKKIHTLLLLGAGESGKSTIIKQMQLLHTEGFSDNERRSKIKDIKDNVRDAILSIVTALEYLKPPIKLEKSTNKRKVRWLLDYCSKHSTDFSPEFFDVVEILWKDKGIKEAFDRNDEYQITDSAKYFLDRINIIKQTDYVPTEQDILRCRDITRNIHDLQFQVHNVHFRMIDVAGQRSERKKWFFCFNDITAVIFVTACSCYNMVLREDANQNRLEESLDLFRLVWNNRWLKRISVILFLNKQDLFTEKIISGKNKLENFFPEYCNFKINEDRSYNEPFEVVRAKLFVRHKFLKITEASEKCGCHQCYPHFTCAIDTENIKRVFNDCKDIIQRLHLQTWDLL